MKAIATITVLLLGVIACYGAQQRNYIDYRLVANRMPLLPRDFQARDDPVPEPTCTTIGKVCSEDCQSQWVCVKVNNVLTPQFLGVCGANETCNNGVCSKTPTPECSEQGQKAFECKTEGVFPDPSTCKRYNYCIETEPGKLERYNRKCAAPWGYHPGTSYCAKPLTNDQCGAEYPVPICTTPGQNAALKDNKSLYYVCSYYQNTGDVLYPYLYLCDNGKQYDGNYGCK